MFCKSCGNEVNEGAAFCPKCGAQIVISKSMVSDENSSGQATAEVISDDKKDRTLRLVATIFFSIWTIFLIRGIYNQWYDMRLIFVGIVTASFIWELILVSTLIISNLCIIFAFLRQEYKYFKASFVIALLGNALYFIYRVWHIYRTVTNPNLGWNGTKQSYVIAVITGYDSTTTSSDNFNVLTLYGSLAIILGLVLFAVLLLKINHNISSILIIILAVLWTTCWIRYFLWSDVGSRWKPLFFFATFTGTAAYALLSIILTKKQAK